ncbi:MAG: DUF3352 domain-containing protein [Bacteroidota bacterium]
MKFLKRFFIIVLFGAIIAGGYYAYDNYIVKHENRADFSVVPNNPIFIISTSNLSEGWTKISESNIWKHLLKNPYFEDINEYAELLDEFLANNKAMDLLLGNRNMLISAHMISGVDYDFLFIVDLQTAKTLSKGIDDALKLVEGYTLKKRKYQNVEILEFTEIEDHTNIIYFYILDNLLVGSFTAELIERSVDQKDIKYWENNEQFVEVSEDLSSRKLLKFFFNYEQLPQFTNIYMEDMEESTKGIADALSFSIFHANLEDDHLSFDGYTVLDSATSYFSALSDVKPGKMHAYNIISDQAALYLSIGFKSYSMFYQSLIDQYKKDNEKDMEDYEKNVQRMEKFLDIDVEKDFFNWIGEEIAFIKLRPQGKTRVEDVVVAIHANDIEDAKSGFGKITNQIKKRSPAKFKSIEYKNFEIKYLEIKGFFKLFLGKLFKKLEKPYITYIEDLMVLSNSEEAIKEIIDEYIKGHTLSHNEKFMDFKDNFDAKSNLSMFLQMPKMYTNLYQFSNFETKKSVKENKDLILSFNRIGFQLVAEGDLFKTVLMAEHDPDAALNDELEKFEKKTSEALRTEDFDSLRFKIILPDSVLNTDGPYKKVHEENQFIKFEGIISNNQLSGIWRTYYPDGNLKSSVNYKDGKVNGEAFFFYDDNKETKMVEVIYEEDVINGVYLEFYQNGAQKATLNYEEGMLNGDAEFYYKTGRTKIKGKYKNGRKKGKWYFYDEKGKLINKERM